MDIRFSSASLEKYHGAVGDFDEKEPEALTQRQDGDWTIVETKPLGSRRIEQVRNRDPEVGCGQLRTALAGSADSVGGVAGAVTDLGSREVKPARSEADERSARAAVEELGWSVVGQEDEGRELEWQSVTRGRHATVKANDRQVSVFVYGKSAALSRALGITTAETDAMDLINFRQEEDGAISFDATRRVGGETVSERLLLRADGLLTSASREARYKPLADVLAKGDWVYPTVSMSNPEHAFNVANAAEIARFFDFYTQAGLIEGNFGGDDVSREALFSLMQDADREIQQLRESGKLKKDGAISNETWWKCLGLKGRYPKGVEGAALAAEFKKAVLTKAIDDYIEAKGWDRLADPKTGETLREWYSKDGSDSRPMNWSATFLSQSFRGFVSAIGIPYSQKLRILKEPVPSRQQPVFDVPAEVRQGGCSASRELGVTKRMKGMKITYRPADNPNQWKTHVIEGYEKTLEDLKKAGFTPQQIHRVGSIANDYPALFGGLGMVLDQSKVHVTAEKKGQDASLTVRMPVIKALSGLDGGSGTRNVMTVDDLVLKYNVRPDGSYENTGIAFVRSDRPEAVQFDDDYYS